MRERRLGNGGSDSGNNLEGGIDRAPRIPDQVTLIFSGSVLETDDHLQIVGGLRRSGPEGNGRP